MGGGTIGKTEEGELVRSLLVWLGISVKGEPKSLQYLGGSFFIFSVFTISILVLV